MCWKPFGPTADTGDTVRMHAQSSLHRAHDGRRIIIPLQRTDIDYLKPKSIHWTITARALRDTLPNAVGLPSTTLNVKITQIHTYTSEKRLSTHRYLLFKGQ
jgi:hypothetical protein